MSYLIQFLNSNFIIAFITLLVGSVAWIIYRKQQRDHKKDAANIVLLEIQNAERVLRQVKESLRNGALPENLFTMQTESWSEYKYLFVRNLDRDEWDTITDFYDKCNLYDEAVKYNNSFFQKNEEQIRINTQRILANFAKDYTVQIYKLNTKEDEAKGKLKQEFQNLGEQFQTIYMEKQGIFAYNPSKPINDAKVYLDGLSINLSQTSVGTKLKKIADIKD